MWKVKRLVRNSENFSGTFFKFSVITLDVKYEMIPLRNFAVFLFFLYFHGKSLQNLYFKERLHCCFYLQKDFRPFSRFRENSSVLIFVLTLMQVLRMRGFDGDFLKRRAGDEEEEEGESSCVDWSNHRVMEWLRQVPPF
jgi:hypothetical protein